MFTKLIQKEKERTLFLFGMYGTNLSCCVRGGKKMNQIGFFWPDVHISRIRIRVMRILSYSYSDSDFFEFKLDRASKNPIHWHAKNPKLAKSFPILSFFPKLGLTPSRCPISKSVSPEKLHKIYGKSPHYSGTSKP